MITLEIITEPITESRRSVFSGRTGAVVNFQGIVRDIENGEKISGIEYEAFEKMARHQFSRIFDEAQARWPVQTIHLVHRIGFVPANEPSLWVEVTAGHRGEAFAACQYIIDEMKKRVPIWKKPTPAKKI